MEWFLFTAVKHALGRALFVPNHIIYIANFLLLMAGGSIQLLIYVHTWIVLTKRVRLEWDFRQGCFVAHSVDIGLYVCKHRRFSWEIKLTKSTDAYTTKNSYGSSLYNLFDVVQACVCMSLRLPSSGLVTVQIIDAHISTLCSRVNVFVRLVRML